MLILVLQLLPLVDINSSSWFVWSFDAFLLIFVNFTMLWCYIVVLMTFNSIHSMSVFRLSCPSHPFCSSVISTRFYYTRQDWPYGTLNVRFDSLVSRSADIGTSVSASDPLLANDILTASDDKSQIRYLLNHFIFLF